MINIRQKNGYVILLTVLMVGAVAVTAASALLLLAVDSSKNSALSVDSRVARLLADACAEEALEIVRESSVSSGYGSLSLGEGSCGYFITKLGGQKRSILASSTIAEATRSVVIGLDRIFPAIRVTYWREVVE